MRKFWRTVVFFKYFFNPLVSIFSLIDEKSIINLRAKINRFARLNNSSVGRYTYIGPGTRLDNVDMGGFCSISWNCHIGIASHELDYLSTSPIFLEKKNGTGTCWIECDLKGFDISRSQIGNDVYIGANAVVLAGITVGDGAVIGVGAVVTKDVPPFAIVGGIPARLIRYRFSQDMIRHLLEEKWWNMPDEKIRSKINIFQKIEPDENDIFNIHH